MQSERNVKPSINQKFTAPIQNPARQSIPVSNKRAIYSTLGAVRGFSLPELLVSIAVLATISLIAAPNLSGYVNKQQVRTTAAAFESAMRYARSEGKARSTGATPSVFLCPMASDGVSCTQNDTITTQSFSNGWLIVQGSINPETHAITVGSILKAHPLSNSTTITTNGVSTDAAGNAMGASTPQSLSRLEYSAYGLTARDSTNALVLSPNATFSPSSAASATTTIMLGSTGHAASSITNSSAEHASAASTPQPNATTPINPDQP